MTIDEIPDVTVSRITANTPGDAFIRAFSLIIRHVLPLFLLASCAKKAPPPAPNGPEQLVIPDQGAYTGAYLEFGDKEDSVSLEAIENFESMVGKHQAIIASSSYWGEQTFPTDNVMLIHRHGSIPLIFWSPWDKPYEEDRGPDRFNLTSIIAGKWDDYIDAWAQSAKEFGHPFFVSFGNESNGSWFPWSGIFYGGSKPIPNTQPQQYEGPETFKRAYRHVVDRVRAKGAKNILWIFHLNNYSIPEEPGNEAAAYYPGSDYVDWLGLSVYGKQFASEKWSKFVWLIDTPYDTICKLDPKKPVMVAEWSVGEYPESGSKPQFIRDAFFNMKHEFPRIKAEVYWSERWQNEDDSYSNLRVNSTPEALINYRRCVKDPYWLGSPVYRPLTK